MWGEGTYPWNSAHILAPFVVGVVLLVAFGFYGLSRVLVMSIICWLETRGLYATFWTVTTNVPSQNSTLRGHGYHGNCWPDGLLCIERLAPHTDYRSLFYRKYHHWIDVGESMIVNNDEIYQNLTINTLVEHNGRCTCGGRSNSGSFFQKRWSHKMATCICCYWYVCFHWGNGCKYTIHEESGHCGKLQEMLFFPFLFFLSLPSLIFTPLTLSFLQTSFRFWVVSSSDGSSLWPS